ncbi:MAG: choice-of-anchor tandem repeat GloVer-containing protein [Rhizomicrobium sp.]
MHRATVCKARPDCLGFMLATVLLIALLACAPAAAHGFKILHTFCAQDGCADGGEPNGLVEDRAGNLYGTAEDSANGNDSGMVFALTRRKGGRYAYSVLYSFCSQAGCADGNWTASNGGLIVDKAGNLYGTTTFGGPEAGGEVYELKHKAGQWKLKVLYGFCDACGGPYYPTAGLTYAGAASGALYDGVSPLFGTTASGGTGGYGFGYGVAFMLQPGEKGWTEQDMYDFCTQNNCADGQTPQVPLLVDASGNLYGTTLSGGDAYYGDGTAFELSPSGNSWTETVLYKFCTLANCADGDWPSGGLVMDASGDLYGTAPFGGASGSGVAYQIVPNGTKSRYTVLQNFGGASGGNPYSVPALDGQSDIFGTATQGSNMERGGTVFAMSGSKIGVLHKFCRRAACPDGCMPYSGVIRDPSGALFGTTMFGGNDEQNGWDNTGFGTVYELAP